MEFWSYNKWYFQKLILFVIDNGVTNSYTPGTRGFSRVRWEFSVLAEGRYIFGRRLKPRAANWQKPETALEKSLAPRVQKMFFVVLK